MKKYEHIYIPPPYRESLKYRMLHWAACALFACVVIFFSIALMWTLAMIHDSGGFDLFMSGLKDGHIAARTNLI